MIFDHLQISWGWVLSILAVHVAAVGWSYVSQFLRVR